ncbi:p30 [Xanthomonas phage Xop411]|uniref:p30 n=1 Tax=Xanthomonas phage Xop411 TaxID=2913975 RepID=A5H1K0_9CAUD|nr:p30 [Xanthomonas phage Xop411]ABK00177.2 p30 [Xanthomonas phage Xop411]
MKPDEIYKILALCNDPLPLSSSGRAYSNWIEAGTIINQYFGKVGFLPASKEGPKRYKK